MEKNTVSGLVRLVISIGLCQAAGIIGSVFTAPAVPVWYATLKKPFFNPPNSVFAPVWTTLFLLMGVSLFLVWQQGLDDHRVRTACVLFFSQLFLNILWSALFFGLHSPLMGFIDIVFLWVMILVTILSFHRISQVSALLMIPYLLWVSFAGVLNWAIWRLNA